MSKASFRRTVSLASTLFLLVMMLTGVLGGSLSAGAEDDPINYAFNPGFEEGSDTEAARWGLYPGWDKGSFIGRDAHSGDRAISVALSEEQNYALFEGGISAGVMDVSAAAKLSMWVKYTGVTGEGFMIGVERKTDGDGDANAFSARYTGSSDGWTQLTFDIPATEKAITELIIKVEIATGAGTLLIDDVVLNGEKPKPPVADPAKNYARNPGFEMVNGVEAGDWGLYPGWDKGSFIGSDAHEGEKAIAVTLSADQNFALYQGGHTGGNFDLKSGAELSFWVKYNLAEGSFFKLMLERKTAAGNDNVVGEAITGKVDDWTQVKLTVPASTEDIQEWILKIDISTGGGTLLIDDADLKIKSGSDEPAPEVPDDKKPGVVITGETGTNLLTNPGFEGGDQDWGVVAGASITTAETHSGAKAVKAVLGAEGYASWNNLVTEFDYSAALRVTYWVKLDGVTGEGVTVGVERERMDENDKWADGSVYSQPLTGTSDWQKVVVEVPAAPGCFKVVAKVNFGSGSGTVYIDDVYIGLADQNQANANFAANPGFEKGAEAEAEKWGLAPGWDQMPSPIETTDVHGGNRAVKITLGSEEHSLLQSNNWGMPQFDLKGEMFLSMWVKYTDITGDGAYLKVERKANDEGVADVVGTPVTGTSNGWVQLKLLVPATTEELEEVVICLNTGVGTGTILVDDVTFRPATQEDKDNLNKPDPTPSDPSDPSTPDKPDVPATGVALPLSAAAMAAASAAVILAVKMRRG